MVCTSDWKLDRWYCCQCSHGPLSYDINTHCPNCNHQLCRDVVPPLPASPREIEVHPNEVHYREAYSLGSLATYRQQIPENKTSLPAEAFVEPSELALGHHQSPDSTKATYPTADNEDVVSHDEQSYNQDIKEVDGITTPYDPIQMSLRSFFNDTSAKHITHSSYSSVLDSSSHNNNTEGRSLSCSREDPTDSISSSSGWPHDVCAFNPTKSRDMVIQWLETLQGNPHYPIIAQAYKEFWQRDPVDGDDASASQVTAQRNHAISRQNKKRGKGKAENYNKDNGDDGDDDDATHQSKTTETHSTLTGEERLLACHFYKYNCVLHFRCHNRGFRNISGLVAHLHANHDLGPFYCWDCKQSFPSAEHLQFHQAGDSCRPVEGIPVNSLQVSRAHTGPYKKWFFIWNELLPQFKEPESPYLTGHEYAIHMFQYIEVDLPERLGGILSPENIQPLIATLRTSRENYLNDFTRPSTAHLATPTATQAGNENSGHADMDYEVTPPSTSGDGQNAVHASLLADGSTTVVNSYQQLWDLANDNSLMISASTHAADLMVYGRMDIEPWFPSHDADPESLISPSTGQDSLPTSGEPATSSMGNQMFLDPTATVPGETFDDVMTFFLSDPPLFGDTQTYPYTSGDATGEGVPPLEDICIDQLVIDDYEDFSFHYTG
ncbi:hypothetical protein F4775DRAFT_579426 [Biscogniauxia sp. FL1348]|nr:hypothetical protein F4775DRAFT_579426 [Biscogniauxia sp. FL1348]